ncbi:two component transcriptional regulator, LuxR [Roseovarius sp. TM1035]|jgi:two-component system nitrate/nitrite response regulator NarP|uniref:response regulator transcription factor n=2 Tax=Roseobacteraceae TaxID=2854170 RepID=UPI00015567B6|nr:MULTISPECIES: response regulator transcription factor [Roseovarius]EDM31253.1 two component transcriptional regulator, LuxR [Roseovarius sp. TM1035]MBW4975585.1 response regulator transcription factor [Roseovarius mucosus]|tara:strand:- start:71 stop:736 length:666 start_codon:yes stop_codon:yes gene_type:complete
MSAEGLENREENTMNNQEEPTLSILVVDDHKLVSEAVANFLSSSSDFNVALCNSFQEAESFIKENGPIDVVLLDLVMPDMKGMDSIASIIKLNEPGAVVLFSGTANPHDLNAALELGCMGLIPKSLPLKSLESAIRLVSTGEVFVRASQNEPSAKGSTESFTERDLLVLSKIAEGKTNKEIAWMIQVSEVSVKSYVRKICMILGATNRASAAVRAKQLGII